MLELIHSDSDLVAIAKPAGRIVVAGRGAAAHEPTLQGELQAQLGCEVLVVHRLDRGTSGVLLFARNAGAHRTLSMAFEHHRVDKRYLALLRGELFGAGEIATPLVAVRGGLMRALRPGERNPAAKSSRTAYRALARFRGFTWAELRPRTGRLHQIRVHAAALGHPLAVDPDYGSTSLLHAGDLRQELTADAAAEVVLSRVPLHAASLVLHHPATGARLQLEAPLPPDLAHVLDLLGS